MHGQAVGIVGGGPTGLMLAGESALAGVDVAIGERRASQGLAGARAGGLWYWVDVTPPPKARRRARAVCTRAPSRCSTSKRSHTHAMSHAQPNDDLPF